MIKEHPQVDRFKEQMRKSLIQETHNSPAIKFAKDDNIYTCGDKDELVYFIESGQIKLRMLSPDRRECLLSIHTAGEMFGELCLSGLGARLETATALEDTNIKQLSCSCFFDRLGRDSLLVGFVQYLTVCIADRQQVIADLVMVDSEKRLVKTLLRVARTMGKKDPRSIRVEPKISDDDLSEMVGASSLQISVFLQRFRNLRLIETKEDSFLVIKEKELSDYLAQIN